MSTSMSHPEEFPILNPLLSDRPKETIPWALLQPHESQARKNHGGQSLKQLAGRGGLGWSEVFAVLTDREIRRFKDRAFVEEVVRAIVAAFLEGQRTTRARKAGIIGDDG